MKIIWDERKRQINLETRGLDFADLTMDFFAVSTIVPARKDRFKAIAELGGVILTVIFRPLGTEAISVVSMPRASRKERSAP